MQMSIKLEGLQEALSVLNPDKVNRAARAAIDRAAKSGASAATDSITEHYNVKKTDLAGRIRIDPPRMDNLTAIIHVSGRGISLSYFGAKQIVGNRVMSRKGKDIVSSKMSRKMLSAGPVPIGVAVQVLKGKQTSILRSDFLAKMKSGHIGVYHRLTAKRKPIAERGVVSIATMVKKHDTMKAITEAVEATWVKEFPRQLDYFMKK